MTDTTDYIKVDIASFQDMCKRIQELEARNEFLERMVQGLKLNNQELTKERNALQDKLNNVSLWDLSPEAQEEAGHALARSLLGGA